VLSLQRDKDYVQQARDKKSQYSHSNFNLKSKICVIMLLAMDRVAFLFLCFIMTFLSLSIVCYSFPFKVRYQRRSVVSSNHRLYSDGDKFEKLMLGAPYSRPLDSKGSYYAKPFRGDQRVMVDYEVASVDDLEGTMDHLIHQIDDHKGT
jgi:hypothetical protein